MGKSTNVPAGTLKSPLAVNKRRGQKTGSSPSNPPQTGVGKPVR